MSYENLIIWQYKGKPKAQATAEMLVAFFMPAFKSLNALKSVLDLENAMGHQLDLVGKHIGISRIINAAILRKFFGFQGSEQALAFGIGEWYRKRSPLADSVRLDDEDYRFLLKCQVAKNYQRTTIYGVNQSLTTLFGQGASIVSHHNLTATVSVSRKQLNSFKEFALLNLDILPRPAGVKYLINIV